ncbi:hypothetical protein T11_8938, partial [Trichinella zimbabwensis]
GYCKASPQTSPYLWNNWPLKWHNAYLNTQQSRQSGTLLIRNRNSCIFLCKKYSLKLRGQVQYFFGLGNSIFLYF